VLSEIPEEWAVRISSWAKENAVHKQVVDTLCVPDANEEYLIYQTVLGMWPAKLDEFPCMIRRLKDYIVKALREATIHTRWIKPNQAHESAVTHFIERILSFEHAPRFLQDVGEFQKRIAWCGMVNSLSQLLLKIISPGTPDFFQGSEFWDFRLVDPDNRGSVNFTERCKRLSASSGYASHDLALDLLQRWPDGQIKLYLTSRALGYRLQYPGLFAAGEFIPVIAQGPRKENVISALRRNLDDQALAVVPRWLAQAYSPGEPLPSADFWGGTELLLPEFAPGLWTNVLTGTQTNTAEIGGSSKLRVADVLRDFPVALLVPGA
jgi:(1->4)-alpha-D-glucan 1-alpha-D-glucosylmutase